MSHYHYAFSFVNLCGWLGLDVEYLRRGLRACGWRPGTVSRTMMAGEARHTVVVAGVGA